MANSIFPKNFQSTIAPLDKSLARELYVTTFGNDLKLTDLPENVVEFFESMLELSPFLKECARRETAFIAKSLQMGLEQAYEDELAEISRLGLETVDEDSMMKALRTSKRRIALLCALGDLSGFWKDGQVTSALSQFASTCLSSSFDFLLMRLHNQGKIKLSNPEAPQQNCGLVVLGMGKFGADELNYSSDIDLVIFFDNMAEIEILTDDPITLLNRMAKQLVKLMQERTSDGYVFRTDLRLRPDPSSTPLIIPTDAALHYYEGQGQNWERAAMIKAAVVAGDAEAGARFLSELTPFVWRKYLDFAAIQDVHSIKRQIHAHKGHGEIRVKGHNIKLGRGGIREIEFFVQTQQLIAGGRNPGLRMKGTVEALEALSKEGWIEGIAAKELSEAYWFLRNLEHRLQMVEDQQTHTLPDNSAEFLRIAHMFGETNANAFSDRIKKTLKTVERYYAQLFETAAELSASGGNLVFTGQDDDPGTIETLSALGFVRPGEVIKLVKRWHVAKIPALQTSQARELLTELVPELLQALGKSADPEKALFTFDQFISGLPAGIQLFSILKSNPALNNLLVRILTAAPHMAEQISRKPHVFDAMLEPRVSDEVPSLDYLTETLEASLRSIDNYEMKLDQARRFFRETRFQIAVRFFSGALDYRNVALALSNLAEVLITVLLELVQSEFAKRHGKVPGAKVCILAMGRLGSRELTAESDLDLIFLYDFDPQAIESDGEKSLDPTLYFLRLTQRFIAAVSSPTAEGRIYELDFRLRPSGNAGPLATHIESFLKYQEENAWVWESQALTRARAAVGNPDLCDRAIRDVPGILMAAGKKPNVKNEIYKMRMLIEKEKGSDNPWEVKAGKGGLVDIEFIAQWLVLQGEVDRKTPTGTRGILESSLADRLSDDQRNQLITAFDLYSTVMHLIRTCLGKRDLNEPFPQGFQEVVYTALDLPDLSACEAHLKQTQKEVREIFLQLLKTGDD